MYLGALCISKHVMHVYTSVHMFANVYNIFNIKYR